MDDRTWEPVSLLHSPFGVRALSSPSEFKVVIFSSSTARDIKRLVVRVQDQARVCGVVYETQRRKTPRQRVVRFARLLKDPEFVRYAAGRMGGALQDSLLRFRDVLLDLVHAARPPAEPEEDLASACRRLGCELLITSDFHADETLRFVSGLQPDLGIVYGTRILKPSLFTIPRLGSINVHKRKVPDYRGGGPVGLWELLDDQPEIGVTVHQVTAEVDAGAIVNSATIPIEPFDTLKSLALKAHVVGEDLLVRSVADFAHDRVQLRKQEGVGRTFKSPKPHELARYERQLRDRRPAYRALRTRSPLKLLLRTLLGLPIAAARNWTWRLRGACPVTILFHHVVADRPHEMGVPTEEFQKHVQYLKRHYRVVSLSEAVEMLRTNRVTAPTVVLTFDDGYGDNYVNLRAVAEALDVKVTLFVSTSFLTSQTAFPHDAAFGRDGFRPFTWEEVAQLARAGFEIGSHTRSHADCGSRDLSFVHDEIVGSKQDLESRLGRPVEFFSFPFGLRKNMSAEALEISRKNYACAVSAFGGRNFAESVDFGHLRRCTHMADLWELELQIQSLLEFAEATSYPEPIPARDRQPLAG